jgi:hypothetical protein
MSPPPHSHASYPTSPKAPLLSTGVALSTDRPMCSAPPPRAPSWPTWGSRTPSIVPLHPARPPFPFFPPFPASPRLPPEWPRPRPRYSNPLPRNPAVSQSPLTDPLFLCTTPPPPPPPPLTGGVLAHRYIRPDTPPYLHQTALVAQLVERGTSILSGSCRGLRFNSVREHLVLLLSFCISFCYPPCLSACCSSHSCYSSALCLSSLLFYFLLFWGCCLRSRKRGLFVATTTN